MKTLENLSSSEQLVVKGYGFIGFTPPGNLVTRVMNGWRKYLQVPRAERLQWRVGDPRDWDDGYVAREGGEYDQKDFFHYRPHLYALLDHAGVDYGEHLEWLCDLDRLWEYCRMSFQKIVFQLNTILPDYDLYRRFQSPVARSRHVIRLLSYNNDLQPGKLLGKAHVDRNFGTFQIFETHPALSLEIGSERISYRPKPGQVLVFTGGKAELLTEGKLKGVKHVITVPDDFIAKKGEARQSIVFFAHVYI
ncbi:MAG: hypothetical protein Q8Q03_01160 [bacterium]|nr:hypothetical protein [bacterium]